MRLKPAFFPHSSRGHLYALSIKLKMKAPLYQNDPPKSTSSGSDCVQGLRSLLRADDICLPVMQIKAQYTTRLTSFLSLLSQCWMRSKGREFDTKTSAISYLAVRSMVSQRTWARAAQEHMIRGHFFSCRPLSLCARSKVTRNHRYIKLCFPANKWDWLSTLSHTVIGCRRSSPDGDQCLW